MQFRKKPVVIEAIQIPDDADSPRWSELIRFLDAGTAKWTGGNMRMRIEIETLEGKMLGLPGDWIIRGVKGEFYPCKPEIFYATYEPA